MKIYRMLFKFKVDGSLGHSKCDKICEMDSYNKQKKRKIRTPQKHSQGQSEICEGERKIFKCSENNILLIVFPLYKT